MNSDAKKKRKGKIRERGIEGLTGGSGVGPPTKKEKKTVETGVPNSRTG